MTDLAAAVTSTTIAGVGVAAVASNASLYVTLVTALTTILVAAINAFAYNRK